MVWSIDISLVLPGDGELVLQTGDGLLVVAQGGVNVSQFTVRARLGLRVVELVSHHESLLEAHQGLLQVTQALVWVAEAAVRAL